MSCHFSPCNTGLSNFPQSLPEGAMLILNDSTPANGHDPELIGRQLAEICEMWKCSYVLLDLQRPVNGLTCQIAAAVFSSVSCPVAISEGYADQLACPVFLSAPPVDRPLAQWLHPWQGREIWLEAALDATVITLQKTGSTRGQASPCDPSLLPHRSEQLHCHYRIDAKPEQICFTLQRLPGDLAALMKEAEALGVAGAVGLYQELGLFFHS